MSRLSIRIAAPFAILLSLIVAADAAAISWTGNRALTTSGGAYLSGAGLAVSSSTVVHAVYEENVLGAYAVVYRRSANSGTTWGTPIQMSTPGAARAFFGSIDALGNAVDAVSMKAMPSSPNRARSSSTAAARTAASPGRIPSRSPPGSGRSALPGSCTPPPAGC